MKVKNFGKVLIVLCLVLFGIGGNVMEGAYKSSAITTQSVAIIDGGVMEKAIHVIPFNM